jgi:Prophage antirepressor
MSTDLKVIDERTVLGKNFRIFGTFEEPLFLAKDVAEWIEYSESNVSKLVNMVDNEEKTIRTIVTSGSNYQAGAWFLTEDGLYEVLMQSRKPAAKEFKKQVKEILKTIRKTGGFVADNREPEFIAQYFPSFSEDVKLLMVQDLLNKQKQLQIERDEAIRTKAWMYL